MLSTHSIRDSWCLTSWEHPKGYLEQEAMTATPKITFNMHYKLPTPPLSILPYCLCFSACSSLYFGLNGGRSIHCNCFSKEKRTCF